MKECTSEHQDYNPGCLTHEAAKNFTQLNITEDGGYRPNQVFNIDETGLFWKKMPSQTYISKSEKKSTWV